MNILENLWAGTEASYLVANTAYAQAQAKAGQQLPEGMSLYERVGTVGVVTVKGSLMPGNAGWMAYFGVIGYDDIRSAVMEALVDPEATSILMMYQSGGGAVTGMTDTADFLRQAFKLKPAVAYVDVAASAAYRLAVESESIIVSDSGVTGSIGVLRIHGESSKQLEQEGIKVTVLRAGEFKALLNPYEPLTPEAVAQENERLAYLADIFTKVVEDRRSISTEDMKNVAGEGREFLGQMGVKAGLADKVGNYESALKAAGKLTGGIKVKGTVAQTLATAVINQQNAANTPTITTMPKPTFSTEQLAALAAGSLEGVTAESLAAELAATAEQLTASQTAFATLQTESAAALAAAQASLATSEQALTLSQARAITLEQLSASLTEDLSTTRSIIVASLDNMTVALGGSKLELPEATPLADLLAKHSETAESYKAKFKVGGVAAVAPAVKVEATPVPKSHSLFAAIVNFSNPQK